MKYQREFLYWQTHLANILYLLSREEGLFQQNMHMARNRFYNELNNLSTADFYDIKTMKKGKYYQVEKVISRRTCKRKVS